MIHSHHARSSIGSPGCAQDSGDLQGSRVEQDVLGAIVAVHENLPATRAAGQRGCDLAGIKLVDEPQHCAAGAQHAGAVA